MCFCADDMNFGGHAGGGGVEGRVANGILSVYGGYPYYPYGLFQIEDAQLDDDTPVITAEELSFSGMEKFTNPHVMRFINKKK